MSSLTKERLGEEGGGRDAIRLRYLIITRESPFLQFQRWNKQADPINSRVCLAVKAAVAEGGTIRRRMLCLDALYILMSKGKESDFSLHGLKPEMKVITEYKIFFL